ncbi:hypothetical protein BDV12DRAFT_190322 [Aspergillus spectabilis]
MARVWLITGPSSGFWHEFVKQILARGDKVIATACSLSKIQHLKEIGTATLDVIAAEAISLFGRRDVLIKMPGIRNFGYLRLCSTQDEYFRAQDSGTVVTIGSMSACETYPGIGANSASKAANRYDMDGMDEKVTFTRIRTLLNSVSGEISILEYQSLRGDPEKGVACIIDVVRGENGGRWQQVAEGIALGPDTLLGIRRRCEETLKLLTEWEEFSKSTDIVE